jgi:hypothetical protein
MIKIKNQIKSKNKIKYNSFVNSSLNLFVRLNVRPLFWESSQAHFLVVIPRLRKRASVMNGFLKI